MKEAAGEANMTVITIILIGIIAAIAIPLVQNAMSSSAKQGCCQNLGFQWDGGRCYQINSNGTRGNQVDEAVYWNEANKTCTSDITGVNP